MSKQRALYVYKKVGYFNQEKNISCSYRVHENERRIQKGSHYWTDGDNLRYYCVDCIGWIGSRYSFVYFDGWSDEEETAKKKHISLWIDRVYSNVV